MRVWPLLLWSLAGCINGGVDQIAGVGATYSTRCSARMTPKGQEFTADCTPTPCTPPFQSVAVNHIVVAVVPNTEVLGFAERVCLQDLSKASQLFGPPGAENAVAPPAATE
jgi:hypothetical protein